MVVDQRNGYAQHDFCKSFARANSFASIKGAKSEWVPLLTVRTHVHVRLWIEAFRVELFRSDPDSRVVLNGLKVNNECCFVRLKVNSANFYVLAEH